MTRKEKELCERVHSFLLGHKKNPFYVLSTEEFGLLRGGYYLVCLLYTSPSPRDRTRSRMPSSA